MTTQTVKRVYELVENDRTLYAVVTDGPLTLRPAHNIDEAAKALMDDIVQYPEFYDVIIEDGVLAVKPKKWYGLYLQREDVTASAVADWLEWGNALVYAAGDFLYVLDIEDRWPNFTAWRRSANVDQLVPSMCRQFGKMDEALNFITAIAPIEVWRAMGANKPPGRE